MIPPFPANPQTRELRCLSDLTRRTRRDAVADRHTLSIEIFATRDFHNRLRANTTNMDSTSNQHTGVNTKNTKTRQMLPSTTRLVRLLLTHVVFHPPTYPSVPNHHPTSTTTRHKR